MSQSQCWASPSTAPPRRDIATCACALADAMTYAFEPRWADLVYSRFGLNFFDDPVKAFTNIRSGMKPDARLVFVTYRPMPESPWFRVPIEAARPHLPPQPPADPLAPGLFSLAREERVREILSEAGFREITLKATDVPIHGKNVAQSMAFLTQAGPLPAMSREWLGRAANTCHRSRTRCARCKHRT